MMARRSSWTVLFFLSYLLLGLLIYRDYGISTDETINRRNGLVTVKYLIRKAGIAGFENNTAFKQIADLHTYRDKDYGVVFELPLVVLERITGMEDNNSPRLWYMRHLCTFLVFYIGVIFFYHLVKLRFNSRRMALLGCFFLVVSPRIFAESFYNGKDVVFLSFFIISTYFLVRFLRDKSFKNAFLLGLSAALTIDVRILGILIPCVALLFSVIDWLQSRPGAAPARRIWMSGAVFLAACMLFTVLFWPYLWEQPVAHFTRAFGNMSKFVRWNGKVLYMGEHIPATEVPWHYIPTWITITTPLLYTLLFLPGAAIIIRDVVKRLPRLYHSDAEQQDVVMASLFFGPLLAVIVLHSVLYDGWRQMYFLYGAFLMIALRGLSFLVEVSASYRQKIPFGSSLAGGVLLLCLTPTVYWMGRNHPYQNVYFNPLAGDVDQLFEKDYWGLSYRQALSFVTTTDKRERLTIAVNTKAGKSNVNMLPKQDQQRIAKVEYEYLLAPGEADYFITDYRYQRKTPLPGQEVYNVQVDGFKIIGVYKIK